MTEALQTNNLRIARTRPLLTPALLAEEIPATDEAKNLVHDGRGIVESILDEKDK